MDTKTCSKCGEHKPISEFYRRLFGRYPTPECKVCARAKRKASYYANPQKALAATKAYASTPQARQRAKERAALPANKEKRRKSNQEWYAANKDVAKANRERWAAANRHRLSELQYLKRATKLAEIIDPARSKPCDDCGILFPLCAMDFDHRDSSTKRFNVTSGQCRPVADILAEIAKCDVVCSNCHRVRTAVRSMLRREAVREQRDAPAFRRVTAA